MNTQVTIKNNSQETIHFQTASPKPLAGSISPESSISSSTSPQELKGIQSLAQELKSLGAEITTK